MLKAGIVGLPNVGKSTIFSAITKKEALVANYPFATIEPNVGIVFVEDDRLDFLASVYKPKKVVPTSYQFIDIAGLVEGASHGEGLGNQFLAHIREVDAICQVVRCFNDDNITHVSGSVDPLRDLKTIEMELYLADLEVIDKRLNRLEKKLKANLKTAKQEAEVLLKVKNALDKNENPQHIGLSKEDKKLIQAFNLLSLKPMMYVLNVADHDLATFKETQLYQTLDLYAKKENRSVVVISAKVENEIAHLEKAEQKGFLSAYGLKQSGLNEIIEKSYQLIGLKTYFTAGDPEVRAWTFVEGMKAPECAGIIHSDFERGFIKAETLAYEDLVLYKTPQLAKEKGKVRLEGKEYLVKDGDIMLFRFNV